MKPRQPANHWPARLRDLLVVGTATGGYSSFIPSWIRPRSKLTGAGLIGTLIGLAAAPLLPNKPSQLIAVLIGIVLIGVVVSDYAEQRLAQHDDPRIIIDEFVGYWFAIAFLPHSKAVLLSAFVLFRVFDVAKWGWISRVADWPGGWGIVMDDVLAGVASNALLQLAHFLHWL